MKRLIAYLFVVIGLGLTFNANAETFSSVAVNKKNYYKFHSANYNGGQSSADREAISECKKWSRKNGYKSSDCILEKDFKKLLSKQNSDKLKKLTKGNNQGNDKGYFWLGRKVSKADYEKFSKSKIKEVKSNADRYSWIAIVKNPKANKDFIATRVSSEINAKNIALNKCYDYVKINLSKKDKKNCRVDKAFTEYDRPYLAKQIINKQKKNLITTNTSSQIKTEETDMIVEWVEMSKKEPSQKQKVAKKEEIRLNFCNEEVFWRSVRPELDFCENGYTNYKKWSNTNKDLKICYRPDKKFITNASDRRGAYATRDIKCNNGDRYFQLKFVKNNYLGDYFIKVSDEIEKKEQTIKPKKKVKVAKVEEPKQEEFKPKKTNQDNEAPVIEIAETITVDSQAYTLKGKVKDKSQIYLTINGRQVDVKKGKFELDRFSIDPDVAEELKIVAIDQWNNKSEKTIKVTIDLQSTDIAKVYEELKPNNVKVKTDKNKIAIIIGIEKYENLTNLDAKYANRDAKAFRTYATRALGIKPSNIKMLIDDKATRSQALKAFKLWLPKIAGKGGKDIHIFFAGHGLASDNGEDLYILPQDGESSLLEDTAISRVELISLINKVNPKSVTMFFDTCYSGQTRDERMLVASLRPIRIVADEQEKPDNFTIFTASNYDQTSGSIEEAQHGMFSYYLMKGLEGKADENKDRKITNGELIAYLKDNVSQEAFTQNRQQDPMLAGDPGKILIKF